MELIKKIDQSFSFDENIIRVVGTYDEPWFVVKDICNILGIKNNRDVTAILPEKWKTEQLLQTKGGNQYTTIINESGLYKIIMRSNKAIAQKFQEAVCEDILPSIRKTGEFKLQKMLEEKNNEIKSIEEENQKMLEEKDNEIKSIEEENQKIKKAKERLEKRYIKTPRITVDGKNVVYLMTTDDGEKKREYAIGKSIDLSNRKYDYDCNKIHDFKVIYYVSCKSYKIMDLLEAIIISKLNKYKCKANRDVLLLPESQDISLFTKVFDENLLYFKDVEPDEIQYTTRTQNQTEYYEDNREKILEHQQEFRQLNSESINENRRAKHEENPDLDNVKCNIYYEEHKEIMKAQAMDNYNENKEVILEQRKDFYQNNKEAILEERKEYYENNYETKIAPTRQTLELCECGMTITNYCMKRHKTSASHARLMEKKNNPEIKEDELNRTKCECGMIVSTPNLRRHTNSDRHKRLLDKKKE